MVFINEWLPNPVGADVKGEFVETRNGKYILFDKILIGGTQFAALLIGAAALVMGLLVCTVKQNENLSQPFFGRN